MKRIKLGMVFAGIAGALLLCGTVATAQDNKDAGKEGKKGGRGASVQQRLDMMSERLSLTDDQKPKVKEVLEASQKKRSELRNDSSLSSDDRREKYTGLMQEEDKKIKAILTPDQQEKWQKMREEFRGRGGKKGEKKDSSDTKKD